LNFKKMSNIPLTACNLVSEITNNGMIWPGHFMDRVLAWEQCCSEENGQWEYRFTKKMIRGRTSRKRGHLP
jgi:hypothetical protein